MLLYVCVCVCVYVYHVCLYMCILFCLGDILYKKKTHGPMSWGEEDFHIDFDVFYGNLVNFSLYFLTYNYIYLESVIHFAT